MRTPHHIARTVVVLFIMLSFNVAAGLLANHAQVQFEHPPTAMIMIIGVVTILLADLIFLYLLFVVFRPPSRDAMEHARFEKIFKRHFSGKNYDEAFEQAFREWNKTRQDGH